MTQKKFYLALIAILVGLIIGRKSYTAGMDVGEAKGFTQGLNAGLLQGTSGGYDIAISDQVPSRELFEMEVN
jgi:hypothetical protein